MNSINGGTKKKRDIIDIGSIPAGQDSTQTSFVLTAGQTATVVFTTIPDDERLGLWEFYFSIKIDVNDDDHLFSEGASLTAGQRDLEIYQWKDFSRSSDIQNIRVQKIRLKNNDSSPHTYYMDYKAYTLSAVTGSN